jgi:hypothetical protein
MLKSPTHYQGLTVAPESLDSFSRGWPFRLSSSGGVSFPAQFDGHHPLDRGRGDVVEQAIYTQKIIQGSAKMFLVHRLLCLLQRVDSKELEGGCAET